MKATTDQPADALLDCGHPPDSGPDHVYQGKPAWEFVIHDGRRICHDCDNLRTLDCGHHPSPHHPFTTGTAHTADGREICHNCADQGTREEMKTATRISAYVSSDGHRLTTWTRGDLGQVFFGARHPRSNRYNDRRYISATDCHGNRWHGTGAPGMYATLRRCK